MFGGTEERLLAWDAWSCLETLKEVARWGRGGVCGSSVKRGQGGAVL